MPRRKNRQKNSGTRGFANPLALIVGGVASLLAGMLGTAHASPALQYPAAQPAAVALPAASATTPTASTANASPAPRTAQLTVINDYFAASIKLVSGTRFEDAAGDIFRSTDAVTLPGKRGGADGTATMSVVRDQSGAAPSGRLTLPGLSASPAYYAHVYAIAAVAPQQSSSVSPVAAAPAPADPPHYATRADLSNLAVALTAAIAATNQGQGSANFVTTPAYESLEKAVSDASRITTLNNVTLNGVTGLTSSDIPDLSASYLSTAGGTITGNLTVTGALSSASLSFTNASTSELSASAAYFGGTATSTFGSDGSLTLAKALAVGSGGTGWTNINSGSILFGSGSLALATSSNLFWDNTDGRLGIGTTSPATTLSVAGNTYLTGGLGIGALNTAAGTLNLAGTSGTTTIASGQGFTIGGSQFVLQQGSGNVGIGTTSPYALLSVGNINGIGFTTATSTFNTTGGINLAAGCFSINGTCVGGTASQWLTSGSNISYSGGNVGIGTTSPATTLSVAGNTYLTGGLGIGVLNTTAGTLNVSNNFLVNASGNTTINTNLTLGKIGSGNAITSDQPSLAVQQRINNAAVNFDLFTLNFEDQSSNTYSTLLKWENSATPEGCILRSGVLWVGTCPTSDPVGDDPTIESLRGIGNTYPGGYTASGDAHGFVDRDPINRSNGGPIGYNSYDARVNFNDGIGATSYNHYAAFQSRPTYQMTGTITNHYGLYDGPTVASGATLTNRNGAYIAEANNSGTISNEFGVYVEGLTAGSNSNYAIYTAGATKSYFGGNVGIGTTTSFGKFAISLNNGDTNTNAFVIASSTANATTTLFTVLNTGNATLAGTLTQNSDARLKTDVTTLDASSSLGEIEALNPVSYQWQDNLFGSGQQLGFIAQQVEQQFPQLVATTAPTALTPGGTLGLNYTGLIAPIVGAIKALASEVSSLEATVAGFAESFTSKSITTGKLCATKSDGTQVCLAGDQLAAFLAADGGSVFAAPAQSGQGSAPTDTALTTLANDATSTPSTTAPAGATPATTATTTDQAPTPTPTPAPDTGTPAPDQSSAPTTNASTTTATP